MLTLGFAVIANALPQATAQPSAAPQSICVNLDIDIPHPTILATIYKNRLLWGKDIKCMKFDISKKVMQVTF
jgi:hypothetical protein